MSTQKLKSFAQRTSIFGVAISVLAAVVLPAQMAFADALNPLTERSLLLSSSAPGYQNTDGSGNSSGLPNAEGTNFAPAGSGPNGQKTGETFSFKVSSDSRTGNAIKGITFQYCTKAAGVCQAPGDNAGNGGTRESNADGMAKAEGLKTSDLEVQYGTDGNGLDVVPGQDFKIRIGGDNTTPGVELTAGEYADWSMIVKNEENHPGPLTAKNNFMTLVSPTGLTPAGGTKIEIEFVADEDNYITNPGSGSFFVKINTYNSEVVGNHQPGNQTYNIDGGVTVANVMTDSIHITTKVLETMSFSVGTRNRDTQTLAANQEHGTCDPIEQLNNNRLELGDPQAEFSLETGRAYDVSSYWRLSSNSSGGASVYYSGNTLANTVGDEISEIGATREESNPGTEQFGLAFADAGVNSGTDTLSNDFMTLVGEPDSRHKIPTLLLAPANGPAPAEYLAPLTAYAKGTGDINRVNATTPMADPALFAFEKSSNEVPALIARNNNTVVSCATAKMRYIANIGADTPAGVYTTKINYLAAPQY